MTPTRTPTEADKLRLLAADCRQALFDEIKTDGGATPGTRYEIGRAIELLGRMSAALSGTPAPIADEAVQDGLASELLGCQTVEPYRGWNITKLNKLADRERARLGLPSVRDLNPDIAKMQDAVALALKSTTGGA